MRIAAVVLSILLLAAIVVADTKIGITRENNMGAPAIPLFEWQIVLILMLLVVFSFVFKSRNVFVDKWLFLGVYVFSLILWLSQPINPAYTATPPRAPNFEIYPFSDPQIYVQYAQSALVGEGFFWPDVPSRPFYISLLTWFHLLGDQDYNTVVVIQTFILAAFPAILYLIGRDFGGHSLGLGLALLAAFRDVNSNTMVQFASNVTYSKLFLSEIPLALFISLLVLILVRWLHSEHKPIWMPLASGGILGSATLIRTQSISLVIVIVLVSFFVISNRRIWLAGMFALITGLVLTLSPWLIRNYFATGGIMLDNPISQIMTRRWSGSWGNEVLPRLEGETDVQYSNRMTQEATAILRKNPQALLRTTANHFINSEIASLMGFPVRFEIISPVELVTPQHVFWRTALSPKQLPVFAFYLILFGLGISAAYRHHKLVGLLPLGFGLVYNAWTALFFSSGERFVVPLDWSVYLYQFFGLIIIGSVVLSFSEGARENASRWLLKPFVDHPVKHETTTFTYRRLVWSFLTVVLLGVFIPFTEFIFPVKYPPLTQEDIAQRIGLTIQEGESAAYGRAIYPRYYYSGEGEPETAKLGYQASEDERLVFFLVGPKHGLVIFELSDAPEFFPHASDVFMIGNWTNGYFSPRIVLVSTDNRFEVYEK